MDIVLEIPWDQGQDAFKGWRRQLLDSPAVELRSRYCAPGQKVSLKEDAVRIRRGLTWGFDVPVELLEKSQEGTEKEKEARAWRGIRRSPI